MASTRVITGSSRAFPVGAWFQCVVLLAVSAYMVYVWAFDSRHAPPLPLLVALLAILAALNVWLIWSAVLATLRHIRYRKMAMQLDPATVVAGGEVSASFVVPISPEAAPGFKVTLSCTEHTCVARGEDHEIRTQQLYAQPVQPRISAAPDGTRLELSFRLPEDARETLGYDEEPSGTSATAGRVWVKWYVRVSAEVPGIDLDEAFEIPVVRPIAQELAPRAGENPSFVLERKGADLHIVQPPWKKPGQPALFAVLAGSVVTFLYAAHVLHQEYPGLVPVLYLAAIGVVAAVLGYYDHELAAEVRADGVAITRRLRSFAFMQVRLERAQIAALEVVEALGTGVGSLSAYSLRVRTRDGKSSTLAEFISRQRDVLALSNLVAARLALGKDAVRGTNLRARGVHTYDYRGVRSPAAKRAAAFGALATIVWFTYPWFEAVYQANFGTEARRTEAPRGSIEVTKVEVTKASEAAPKPALAAAPAPAVLSQEAMAALAHFNASRAAQQRKDLAGQERELLKAFVIMEKIPDAEWRRMTGITPDGPDAALAAADLGYIYWEWRRPQEAYNWYARAHQAGAALVTTEENRNRRLAVSAAGLMVTACTLSKWDIADQAMSELKQRMPAVEPDLRKWLDYWVQTGEPRLKARKC
jgi:hypothetical protein